jgi:MarR family transcriptional regulator, transcriptional regulator for hemolysin
VLLILAQHSDRHVILSDLAVLMHLRSNTLTQTIDRLEAKFYVSRRSDSSDRRVKRIVLTSRGSEVIAEIESRFTAIDDEIFRTCSKADAARMEGILRSVKCELVKGY